MNNGSVQGEEDYEYQGFMGIFSSVEEEDKYQEFKIEAQKKTADEGEPGHLDGWQLLWIFVETFANEKYSATVPFPRWLLKHFAFAFRAMLEDTQPSKALGLTKKRGRRADLMFPSTVLKYVEDQRKNGMKMTEALQKAADHFHKDFRHIQRTVAKAKSKFP